MSLIERQEVLSEDITEAGDNDNMKLVPVAESIRYRKRAQSAERKVEDLTEQLAEAKSQATKISERLKKEKQYLFGGVGGVVTAKKTAGAKGSAYGGTNNQTVLEKAAKRAATTGNRADLQEYLKLRRNFL